ncbi:MAG: multidrug effflux MFS transporter [Xanthomonadaceae bacterium]|nr:multidrug effflux MFS transporter [Xanthomonadaceae bacterium]
MHVEDATRKPGSRRLSLILGGLAMLGPFSIDTMFPAFPQIGEQFGADKVAMQQTISVYLLAYALMSLVHGPLSDAVGRKRVILGGLMVFALASVGCAMATSLPMLLFFRALQGMSAGVGLIVGRAVIRDVFQGQFAQKLMSQVSMIFGIAPALAPILGGWILGWERWPAIFCFLVMFALLMIVATWLGLPETHPPESRFRPSPKQLLRNHAYIFLNRRFQRFAAAGAFNFAALFLYIASAPAFVLDHLKLQEDQFGWFFVPTIAGMVFGAFLSGRAAGRMSGTRLAGIGFALCGFAAVSNIAYTLWVPEPTVPLAILPMAINAMGISLVFPILTLAILDMYPRQRGAASSLQAFTSLILQTAVAGLFSPMLSHHPLWLALGAAACTLVGFVLWWWEVRHTRLPPESEPVAAGPPAL